MAQLVEVMLFLFFTFMSLLMRLPLFFPSLRTHLDPPPIAPVLIGDFSCVQDPIDYTTALAAVLYPRPHPAGVLQKLRQIFAILYPRSTVSTAEACHQLS